MAKSRAEMMKHLGKLLAEYAEFQRRRPDLPQGNLCDLSEQELECLVTEFQRDRAAESDDTDPTRPKTSAPLNIARPGSRRAPGHHRRRIEPSRSKV